MDPTHYHLQRAISASLGFVSLEFIGPNGGKLLPGDIARVSVNIKLLPDYFGLLMPGDELAPQKSYHIGRETDLIILRKRQ